MTIIEQIIDDELITAFETEMMFWQRPAYNLAVSLIMSNSGVSEKEAKQYVVYETIQRRPETKARFQELAKLTPSPKP